MLQLQQLGLPSGFRSKVYWWQDYLINNFHQYAKKKYPRGSNRYEKGNPRLLYRQKNEVQGRS